MKREVIANDIIPNEYKEGEPGRIDGKRTIRYSGPGEKDIYKTDGTRAWRNNNPGNIVCSSFAKRKGSIGCDGIMAIFPDAETGEKAQKDLLRTETYKNRSVREVVKKYAPKKDGNPTEKYIQYVTDKSGVPEGKKIKDMTDQEFEKFRGAMKKFENTTPGKTQTGGDAPRFVPGKFQTKRGSGTSDERLAKTESPSSDSKPQKKKSRVLDSGSGERSRDSGSGCRETLERQGKRVYRKEADCSTRGSFYSG